LRARGKGALHRVLLKLHLYVGLFLGLPVLVLAVTGCLLIFQGAVDGWLNPHLVNVTPQARRLPLQELVERVRAAYPKDTPPLEIRVQNGPAQAATSFLRRGSSFIVVHIDQYTGAIKGDRVNVATPLASISRLHTGRVASRAGQAAVGIFTVIALVNVSSGLYLWWPRKILSVKWRANWRRVNFDLHNVFGVFSSVILLFVMLAGVMITWEAPIEAFLVRWLDGKEIERPPKLESTVVEGGRRLTLDEAVEVADRALPGTYTVGINILPPGKGVYQVMKRFPEDKTGAGRSRVLVDQYSGKVLRVVNSRELPLGTRIMNFSEPVHTGIVLGWPTVVLTFLATAALAGQVISGFLIWWKPRRRTAEEEQDAVPRQAIA
jgi:uncharacterized iron-regulated membrane protein